MKLLGFVSKRGLRNEIGKLARKGYAIDKSAVYGKRCTGLYVTEGVYDFYLDLSVLTLAPLEKEPLDEKRVKRLRSSVLPLGRVWVCGKSTHYEPAEEATSWLGEKLIILNPRQLLTDADFDGVMDCADKTWFHDHLMSFDIPY